MNLSLGEFRALVAKAFRGAGYSWGLTEDAAFASVRLAECGLDAGSAVVRLLQATEGAASTLSLMPTESWECIGEFLCPICVGTTIADSGECADITVEQLVEPLFVAPFLMPLIEPDIDARKYVIEWEGGRCVVGAAGIITTGSAAAASTTVTIARQTIEPSVEVAPERHTRVDLGDATKIALEGFAHRTYAPGTEASRLAGAGAGLVDDD